MAASIQFVMKKMLVLTEEAGSGFCLGELKVSRRRQHSSGLLKVESRVPVEKGAGGRREECTFRGWARTTSVRLEAGGGFSLMFDSVNMEWCLLGVLSGARCWGRVLPVLREDGRTCCIDLPWMGVVLHLPSGAGLGTGEPADRSQPFYHVQDVTFRTVKPL